LAAAIAIAPPDPPSPTTAATSGTPNDRHFLGGAGDRFGLTAFLGLDAGKGAGRIDQGDHRKAEPIGDLHQPDRLAVAFRPGHPEIVLQAARCVVAFLMADEHHLAAGEPPQAADDRLVLAEIPVSGEWHEIGNQGRDIVLEMGPFGMPRDLGLLPRGQLRIGLAQQPLGTLLEPLDLGLDVELAGGCGFAQFGDARLELRNRLFEIEKGRHEPGGLSRVPPRVNAAGVPQRVAAVDQLDQPP
jgi:hypothetical protein